MDPETLLDEVLAVFAGHGSLEIRRQLADSDSEASRVAARILEVARTPIDEHVLAALPAPAPAVLKLERKARFRPGLNGSKRVANKGDLWVNPAALDEPQQPDEEN